MINFKENVRGLAGPQPLTGEGCDGLTSGIVNSLASPVSYYSAVPSPVIPMTGVSQIINGGMCQQSTSQV